ncbi:MAG: FAD-binding oxidoreductase [Candidatus Limnocylindrales bacterium]
MTERADLVVVGAGTLGGWASVFAAEAGLGRVVVVDRGAAGMGASSRAAGIVRAQGGTPATVALGRWSIDFYRRQAAMYGTDSGFCEHGYLILAISPDDERAGRERVVMQRGQGLDDVHWLEAAAATEVARTLAPDAHRGGSYRAADGHVDPPRNVRAYGLAMQRAGVELREGVTFTGLRSTADGAVTTVETSAGPIVTDRVILTGGPSLRSVGELAGLRIPVGAARHTVAVLEPHEAFAEPQPMVFDIAAGLYWRREDGGLLFGWSDPDEAPGEARAVDWAAYERYRDRLASYVPVTRGLGLRKIWAATIDYTPDHAPIIGPAVRPDGRRLVGVTIAAAGGHGMMWGPGIARAAADLAIHGRTDVLDVTDLGLDRFDAQGRSRLTIDPVTLPYPVAAD